MTVAGNPALSLRSSAPTRQTEGRDETMATPIIDWRRLWHVEFAPRFDQPVSLDAREPIPRALIIPLYVWMRQDPAWSRANTARRLGLGPTAQDVLETWIARQYPDSVLPPWTHAGGGGCE